MRLEVAMYNDYKLLFENAKIPMIIVNGAGEYLDHNKAYRDLMGFTKEGDLQSAHAADVSTMYQPNGVLSSEQEQINIGLALKHGWYRFPWLHKRPDGETFLSDVFLEKIIFNKEVCLKVSIFDIDEEGKIKHLVDEKTKELLEKNRILESIFNNGIVGMLISDNQRVVWRVNQCMADILKCKVEDILGHTMRNFCESEEAYHYFGRMTMASLAKGEVVKSDFKFVATDGSIIWCHFSGGSLDTEHPSDLSKGMFWLVEDITERKVLAEKLKEQYEQAKDSNPLTGLPGNNAIKEQIKKSVQNQMDDSIMYIDIDNFKSFNDTYGFIKGDEVLIELANTLEKVALDHGLEKYFTGNIGGDDFVVITTSESSELVAQSIIKSFDENVLAFYSEEDRNNMYIKGRDREGTYRKIPLMSISIASVALEKVRTLNYFEVIDVCVELKSACKKVAGSVYLDNRRQL